MIATEDNIKHKEHLLAKNAHRILEHQQELQALEDRKTNLQNRKPESTKDWLSYKESIEFGKRMKQYEEELNRIEIQIQKLTRELNGLELQAQKLLPVAGVKIKVSTYSDDGTPNQSFNIQYNKAENQSSTEGHFKVERL